MKKSVIQKVLSPRRVRLSVEIDGELWVRLTTTGVRLELKKNEMVSAALEDWLIKREGQ